MDKKRIVLSIGLCAVFLLAVHAQQAKTGKNPFWKDWNVQVGLDMTLQNPYGYNFADVFPNGKTFGFDVSIGKVVTPQIGFRGKLNRENKLPLLKNGHANWLAPFYQPGINRDKGGYIGVYGDLLLNVKNLIGECCNDRIWNVSVYPRMGVVYNFGVKKGAALLGAGVMTTYRLNSRWRIYGDVAYNMCGSGFVGTEKVAGTGTGSNSNGFLDLNLGVQYELSKKDTEAGMNNVSFWDNWFVQLGTDVSLMNPYGCDFSEVFPKGKTFGLDAAIGKRFTKDFSVRARLNWENGLIKNNSIEWVPPTNNPKENYEKGGFMVMNLDALFNLHEILDPLKDKRKWNLWTYLRGGLISHLATSSGSPLLGAGIENTYHLNDRWSLYGDVCYQVTTSESSGGRGTGMEVAAGTNGFFNIEIGTQLNL